MDVVDPAALAAVEKQQLAVELRERLPSGAADISVGLIAKCRQDHENWEKRFGEVIRRWRLDRNWSQEEVAERLRHQGFEMHQTTIAKIERGARPLRVAEASALGAVFDMPPLAVFEVSLPNDAPWWTLDGQSEPVREKQKVIEQARRHAEDAREKLDSAAKEYAYFLGEVEKVVLALNAEGSREVRDAPEA